ncbi:MAG: nucleotidyltransferase domain-containing protein [Clostridia bacterium]|nr:nucleotidyltransferase domain-containing protein [Clostridia bacterium]
MTEKILKELSKIEEHHGVRILYALESGSRAWGFASPDSDFDVRFVYVKKPRDYLRLDRRPDVIEWVNDGVLDINGWDVSKVLQHLHRSNANVFEWIGSPIVYRTSEEWREIASSASSFFREKAAMYHYYGLARRTFEEHLRGETVSYKKCLYALRPLLANCYILSFHACPPVPFEDLLRMELPEDLMSAIRHLLEIKRVTTEGEKLPQIPELQAFLQSELTRQKSILASFPEDRENDWDTVNRLFLRILGEVDGKKRET